jgi:hypothetical protein
VSGSGPADLPALLSRTVADLTARSVADEALGELRTPRFRAARIVPIGRVWRLGVLLLDRDGALYATGSVTRAIVPQRGVANKSPDAEVRREFRRAAARGRFSEGEVVNFGVERLSLDVASLEAGSGPLRMRDGEVTVLWNPADPVRGLRPIADYLSERAALTEPR